MSKLLRGRRIEGGHHFGGVDSHPSQLDESWWRNRFSEGGKGVLSALKKSDCNRGEKIEECKEASTS